MGLLEPVIDQTTEPTPTQTTELVPEPEPPPSLDELIPPGIRVDNSMTIQMLSGGETLDLPMELYLIGVVSAEMPASFELEALKAQVVAARTNALYNEHVKPKSNHPDVPVCADFACCMAYSNDERLRERWGDDYVKNIAGIITAVTETDGIYMSYDGEPIFAAFHSSSAGKTETSGNVWVTDLPYLQSVDSPETSEYVPDFIFSTTIPRTRFVETINDTYPDVVLGDDEMSWITDITYTDSGRVSELTIGGQQIMGTALRSMFSLRSTSLTFEWVDDGIVITTTGFGHGVGLSQYGANVMAANGKDYTEILLTYYTGITLDN